MGMKPSLPSRITCNCCHVELVEEVFRELHLAAGRHPLVRWVAARAPSKPCSQLESAVAVTQRVLRPGEDCSSRLHLDCSMQSTLEFGCMAKLSATSILRYYKACYTCLSLKVGSLHCVSDCSNWKLQRRLEHVQHAL